MASKTRRPQAQKNRAYMRGMQELRRSNATGPIPSGSRYNRDKNKKHRNRMFSEV